MTTGYQTGATGVPPDTQGALSGPENALAPKGRAAYGNAGTQRAIQSYSQIPSVQELMDQALQGSRQNTFVPQMPVQPADALNQIAGQPVGPPQNSEGSIPVLSGIGNALDMLGKIALAPAYLGKYRDPNTDIVYTAADGSSSPIDKMFPELWPAKMLGGGLAGTTEAAANIQKQYGLNPLEQMGQVFQFGRYAEASNAAVSAEARGVARAVETAIPILTGGLLTPPAAALSAAYDFGPTLVKTMMSIANGDTALQSIQQTPGVIEESVRAVRNAYVQGAAGEPSALRDFVGEAFLNPSNVLLGALPIMKIGKLGLSGIGKLPVVGPFAAKSYSGMSTWLGTGLFAPLDTAKAHLAAEEARNAITAFSGTLRGTDPSDVPGLLRNIREFRSTPIDELDMDYLIKNSPADYKRAQMLLQKYSTPAKLYNKNLKDPVAQQAWLDQQIGKTPLESELRALEAEFADNPEVFDPNRILLALDDAIRTGELRELRKDLKPGFFGNLIKSYEGALTSIGSWWRPMTLFTRPIYFTNNMASGMAMNAQHFGAFWGTYKEASHLATENGFIPAKAGGILADMAKEVNAAPSYLRSGFGAGMEGSNIPEWLSKIPVIGKILGTGATWANKSERLLHEVSFNSAFHDIAAVETKRVFDSMAMTPEGRAAVDSIVGAAHWERWIKGWQTGKVDPRVDINPGLLNHRVNEKLQVYLDEAEKAAGGVTSHEGVERAFQKTEAHIIAEGAQKRADFHQLSPTGAGEIQDALKAAGQSATPNAERILRTSNAVEKQIYAEEDMFQRFVNKITTERRTKPIADEVEPAIADAQAQAAAENTVAVQKHLARLRGDANQAYLDARRALLDETSEKHSVLEAAGELFGSPNRNALWDGYADSQDALLAAFQRRLENLHSVAYDAVHGNWPEKQTIDEFSKLVKDWQGDTAIRPITEEANKARAAAQEITNGNLPVSDFDAAAIRAGWNPDQLPGQPPDWAAMIEKDVNADLRKLRLAHEQYLSMRELRKELKVPGQAPQDQITLEAFLGVDPGVLTTKLRQATLVARDKADRVAKKIQMDYQGDRTTFDRIVHMVYPFGYWQSRYMLFQVREAVRNPYQAEQIMKVMKSWWDANEDKPWYGKFDLHVATINQGQPDQMDVQFSPTAMFFPLGSTAANVLRSADSQAAGSVTQGFEQLSNFLGGGMWPWYPMLASVAGADVNGGQPKSLLDQVKTLMPPLTWARQGVAALMPGGASSLAMLTGREQDQVIKAMTDDTNAGLLDSREARNAAVSIKKGTPDDVANRYLMKVNPQRFAASMVHAVMPMQGTQVPGEITNLGWQALGNARTEADRQAVYQAFPGLGSEAGGSLAGKTGPELQLAMLHAAAPIQPEIRSMYYRQNRDEIAQLTNEVARHKGEEPADWKLQAATPESFNAFRLAGGSQIVPELVKYWLDGDPLSKTAKESLYKLYDTNGMGSINFAYWRDTILPDAYRQWVLQNAQTLKQGGR